jgi:predicted phage baseplate assembly protein
MSDTCGCCHGTETLTPQAIANCPALSQIEYRVGTHGAFLNSMLARLSNLRLDRDASGEKIEPNYPLSKLTTRSTDDFSIALLDGWATVADVLTFYQERIANEGYLRTATERRSILELARLVGYTLRPGVAASTYLAFELDRLDGGQAVEIPAGSAAASLPLSQDEKPQTFETAEKLPARVEWNALKPRLTCSQDLTQANAENVESIWLKGTAANLKPNDCLLFVFGDGTDQQVLRRVKQAEPQFDQDRTLVLLQVTPTSQAEDPSSAPSAASTGCEVYSLRVSAPVFGHNAPLAPMLSPDGVVTGYAEWTLDNAAWISEKQFEVQINVQRPAAKRRRKGTTLGKKTITLKARVEKASGEVTEEFPFIKAAVNLLDPDTGEQIDTVTVVHNPFGHELTFHFENHRTTFVLKIPPEGAGDTIPPGDNALVNDNVGVEDNVLGVRVFKDDGQEVRNSLITIGIETQRRAPEVLSATVQALVKMQGQYTEDKRRVWLDTVYPQIVPGSWVIVDRPDGRLFTKVVDKESAVRQLSRAAYGVSGRCTCLDLEAEWIHPASDGFDVIRQTTIHAQSEQLDLAEVPDTGPIKGKSIPLDGLSETNEKLARGRWLVVAGQRMLEDKTLVPDAELVRLDHTTEEGGSYTTIYLQDGLQNQYQRDTVTLYANVVRATHGETREEVLGSADASQAFQSFPLSQKPLTFVATPENPTGAQSTLKTYVDERLWNEVETFVGQGSADRVYLARTDDDDNLTIVFGNGREGQRPPSGANNVRAGYRVGLGQAGNVQAGQINQLVTRPLGVKGVQNPVPATGGADRDGADEARWKVPLRLMALDRLVSVQDYADFARAFAGIGKANAALDPAASPHIVHVAIAGQNGSPIAPESDLFKSLERALKDYGDPCVRLKLAVCERIAPQLTANVCVLPDYAWDDVKARVRAAVLDAFSFQNRELGQDLHLSEVIAAIQNVPGVACVDVVEFHGKDAKPEPEQWIEVDSTQIAYFTDAEPDSIDLRQLVALTLKANLQISSGLHFKDVKSLVRTALLDTFDYRYRNPGQGISLSEVTATIQDVLKDASVNVVEFHRKDVKPGTEPELKIEVNPEQIAYFTDAGIDSIDLREILALTLKANIGISPDSDWEDVKAGVCDALPDAFGYRRREPGQDIYRSEVIAAIQSVPGVTSVDVVEFHRKDAEPNTEPEQWIKVDPTQIAYFTDAKPDSIDLRKIP